MKQLIFLLAATLAISNAATSQNYYTKNGKVSFFSKTSMENIDAVNNQAVSILNTSNGEMAFSVLIKGFLFKKELMQEHFNENYMESDKFPKATFKGSIADVKKVTFTKDGSYPVTVNGDLTIHGVTKKVAAPGTITVKAGKITGASTFTVALADYNISIPKVVENNISKTIEIKVECNYDPKK